MVFVRMPQVFIFIIAVIIDAIEKLESSRENVRVVVIAILEVVV